MAEPVYIIKKANFSDTIGAVSDNLITLKPGEVPASDCTLTCLATVSAKDRDNHEGGSWYLVAGFKYKSSSFTILGSPLILFEEKEDPDWQATIILSGTDIAVEVTGSSGKTVSWGGEIIITLGITV